MLEGRRRMTGGRRKPEKGGGGPKLQGYPNLEEVVPPGVVQGLFLLRPASCYLLLNDFDTVNICWTYVILCRLNN
jgi:hypothetical protein